MAFKFNFGGPLEDEISPDNVDEPITTDSQPQAQAQEISRTEEDLQQQDFDTIWLRPNVFLLKGNVASQKCSIMLKSGVLAVSDLVPGKYEGGFKLWECAVDLAIHLCTVWDVTKDARNSLCSNLGETAEKTRVLELGCGHGLPGILAACLGTQAHFQDYNKEVLTGLTMPNLRRNLEQWPWQERDHSKLSDGAESRFFSGGWGSLKEYLQERGLKGTYDYVLTSDTIYSPGSQQELLDCIYEALKPGGTAFVAAKTFYFGVGGGTEQFKQLAVKSKRFSVSNGPIFDDGASNKREIFSLVKL